MFSKAKIAGHPIHPMLVGFPLTLYVGTVASLVAYGGTGNPFWFHVASVTSIAAVVMGLGAAIPGLIDLVSLPAPSRARTTGLQHAALNAFAIVMFAIAAISLNHDWRGAGALHFGWPLVSGLLGLASMALAGSLGWKLVQTHHVGVKPTVFPADPYAPEDVEDLDELPITAYPTVTSPGRRVQYHH